MNVDEILRVLSDEQVDYLLIGGMNFLLRHLPELTFDVDIWVRDEAENLERLNRALGVLGAAWGEAENDWRPVPEQGHWLQRQGCYCLTTEHGALDVFRDVRGLEGRYDECKVAGLYSKTSSGVPYHALSDEHMLAPGSGAATATEATLNRSAPTSIEPKGTVVTSESIKREEERKREAAYDPAQRWLHIQQTITWAEKNLPPHLRRNRPRMRAGEPGRK